MEKVIEYKDLEKHFTAPEVISPFYADGMRIPRKLKKKVKTYVGVHWDKSNQSVSLWHYMEKSNPDYKRFLIKQVCKAQPTYISKIHK